MIVLATFWFVYPFKTIELKTPLKTDKQTYNAGDILYYTLDYCKYTKAPVHISRAYVDSVIYSTPDIEAQNPTGCRKSLISIPVPNLPTGMYYLRVSYSYEVNPIRKITSTFNTNLFQIVERK